MVAAAADPETRAALHRATRTRALAMALERFDFPVSDGSAPYAVQRFDENTKFGERLLTRRHSYSSIKETDLAALTGETAERICQRTILMISQRLGPRQVE